MKILISGGDKVFAIENFYVKYLREMNVDVFHFSAQSLFYDFYQKSVLNKILFKSGLSKIHQQINDSFKSNVEAYKPDVIWVFKGMEIYASSLQWAKEKGIKLVNYNPDNPFLFSGKGSGNRHVTESIGVYDLHLTYNAAVQRQMQQELSIQTEILPFGFDVSDALYQKAQSVNEVVKVCFLGNPDSFRGEYLSKLADHGIFIDVYGNNWGKYVKHPNVTVFNPVYGDDFWITLYKYRIQLNLMRPHNPDTHNMRSFEVPGIGGIQLAPDTDDHKTYFEPEKEIFVYSHLEGCILQINKILALPANEAQQIRKQAREWSIQSGYSYKDRSRQALEKIEKLFD